MSVARSGVRAPMPPLKRALRRSVAGLFVLAVAYLGLLVFPDPLFAHVREGRSITIHADAPVPASADSVVQEAEARLARSPIFDVGRHHDVYVCQSAWRWRLLSPHAFGAGAYAFGPFARPIYTRPVHFDRDRLVGPSGREASGERTLAYFLAHEVTHTLTADFLGPRAFFALPAWVREGYADYVARADTFDYERTRERLLTGDRELDPRASGLYLRYALLVAHLIDREGWTAEQVLREAPDRDALEARVRSGSIAPR
jgi:hypothetical protein